MTDIVESPDDLTERCKELLEWRRTGLLNNGSGGAMRAMAERLKAEGISDHYALSVAETKTRDEAMAALIVARSQLDQAKAAQLAAFIAGYEEFPGPTGSWDRAKISKQAKMYGERYLAAQTGEQQ